MQVVSTFLAQLENIVTYTVVSILNRTEKCTISQDSDTPSKIQNTLVFITNQAPNVLPFEVLPSAYMP